MVLLELWGAIEVPWVIVKEMGAAKQAGKQEGLQGFGDSTSFFFFLTLIQRLATLKITDSETSIL